MVICRERERERESASKQPVTCDCRPSLLNIESSSSTALTSFCYSFVVFHYLDYVSKTCFKKYLKYQINRKKRTLQEKYCENKGSFQPHTQRRAHIHDNAGQGSITKPHQLRHVQNKIQALRVKYKSNNTSLLNCVMRGAHFSCPLRRQLTCSKIRFLLYSLHHISQGAFYLLCLQAVSPTQYVE